MRDWFLVGGVWLVVFGFRTKDEDAESAEKKPLRRAVEDGLGRTWQHHVPRNQVYYEASR